MSNLIPERRADKRGNIVTRWVRSFAAEKLRKSVPAPVFTPEERARLEANDMTMTRLFPYSEDRRGKDLRPNIAFLQENLPELMEKITDSDITIGELGYWRNAFQGEKLHAQTPEEHDDVVERCRRKQKMIPVVVRLTGRIEGDNQRVAPYLSKFVGAVERISGQMPAEEWDSKFEAITTACFLTESHLADWEYQEVELEGLTYADLEDKVEYILENGEQVSEILPELLKRGSCDLQIIKGMAESPAKAIMEGEL